MSTEAKLHGQRRSLVSPFHEASPGVIGFFCRAERALVLTSFVSGFGETVSVG